MPSRPRVPLIPACLLVLAALACRIEDRTPTGSRRDDAEIQALLNGYHRTLAARDWHGAANFAWRGARYAGVSVAGRPGITTRILPLDSALVEMGREVDSLTDGSFDVRVLRTDVRQEGDLATAWVTTRRRLARDGALVEEDWLEHFVLRRTAGGWRILHIARAQRTPRSTR